MNIKTRQLKTFSDSRGDLFKLFGKVSGEVYAITISPKSTRGGHYHKNSTEEFACIQGDALLTLTDLNTQKTVNLDLKGIIVTVPPKVVHSIYSENGAIVVASMDMPHNPDDVFVEAP